MKRFISIFVCMLLLLTACTGNPSGPASTEAQKTEKAATEKITDAATEAPTETPTEAHTEPVTEPVTEPLFKDPDPEVLAAPAATQFTVSRVFSKDMVIQRNEYIRIWGYAKEDQNGKRVNAEFAGLTGAALIEDGHWYITLNGSLPECTEGRQFRVYGDGVEVVFDGVLVGDVYWMAGQSNAAYNLAGIINEPLSSKESKSIVISDDDQIRLHRSTPDDIAGLTVGTVDMNENTPIRRGWQKPKAGAYYFSALGYCTAKQLYDKLERKVPIGMIEFAAGGVGINAFCPNEVCDALKIDKADKNGVYYAQNVVNNGPSRFMYNHYVYAFQKYPICGIIWYQGESDMNSKNDEKYPERFAAMITEYRNRHDLINHDYPVFVVELPAIWQNFNYSSVRTYMGTIPNYLDNAHICQSSDLWKDKTYANNLHPYVKWEQAVRMTSIIMANIYGVGDPEYAEGPSAVSIDFSDGKCTATIKFRNVGDGLKFEGDSLKGFKVKLSSKLEDPDSVEIVDKDTVVIKTSKAMRSVHYNANMTDTFPETLTLCNSDGVPCTAFIFK